MHSLSSSRRLMTPREMITDGFPDTNARIRSLFMHAMVSTPFMMYSAMTGNTPCRRGDETSAIGVAKRSATRIASANS